MTFKDKFIVTARIRQAVYEYNFLLEACCYSPI